MDASQNEMTSHDYGNVVIRRKWIVGAATLLSVVLSALQTPVYSASAEVLVQQRGQDGLFDDQVVNFNDRAIQTEIQVIEGQDVGELLAASAEVQRAIGDLQASVDALEEDDQSRAGLVTQLSNFNPTLDQLRVDAALRTGGAAIIKDAELPTSPVEPTPLGTEDDLEPSTRQPVLAVVPVHPPADHRPIALSDPSHFLVEAYRGLRTNLQFLGLERPLKVLQLTSSLAAEGKTTTACNLAVVLEQAGNKVALVAADPRRPRVHEVFGLEHGAGLTDLLPGAKAKSLVKHVDVGGGPNLPTYTSGAESANPSEILSGRRVRGLLNEMAKHYEHLVVDSAPVLGMVLNKAAKRNNNEYSYGGYKTIVPQGVEITDDFARLQRA